MFSCVGIVLALRDVPQIKFVSNMPECSKCLKWVGSPLKPLWDQGRASTCMQSLFCAQALCDYTELRWPLQFASLKQCPCVVFSDTGGVMCFIGPVVTSVAILDDIQGSQDGLTSAAQGCSQVPCCSVLLAA